MDDPAPLLNHARLPLRRWFGKSAYVTVAVFVLGRIALEPLRDAPHYDSRGMEAFSAVETYLLRKDPHPPKIAFFGSSQSLWGILPENVANHLGEDPMLVRNLATEGGTPFDMWNLIRRNEDLLKELRLAIVEVNPFVLKQGMDSDPRVTVDIAQHATIQERLMLAHRTDRVKQMAEWTLPLLSVRRSLESAFLNVVDPEPGLSIYPWPEERTVPSLGWKVDGHRHVKKQRLTISPMLAARRMLSSWRVSKLQDHAFRQSLEWFEKHHVHVIFHELPVHPEVMAAIHQDPALEKDRQNYMAYVESLSLQPIPHTYTPDPAQVGITAEDMADRTHVNERGARIYSQHLGAVVKGFVGKGE